LPRRICTLPTVGRSTSTPSGWVMGPGCHGSPRHA